MNKAELIAAITPLTPKGMTVDETSTNAELETILEVLSAAGELTKAKEDLGAANEKVKELTKDLEDQGGEVIALNEQLAAKEAVENSTGRKTLTVKVGDDLYIVKSGVKVDIEGQNKTFTKEEIAANKDGIADILVQREINVLKAVN